METGVLWVIHSIININACFMMLVFKIIFKLKNKKQKIVFFSILLKINVFDKLLFFIF